MGWLIAGSILFLLAVLPLGVSARYNDQGALVRVILGPIKLTVFPRPKKEKKEKKNKEKEPTPEQAQQAAEEESLPKPPEPPKPEKPQEEPRKEKGGSLMDFLPLVKIALELLGDLRRKLRLNNLELKIIMAGGDPCDLAVNYGRAWTAVGNLLPQLERLFVIKKRDIEAECDFTADKTLVIARLDLTITLGRVLALAAVYGFRAVREYFRIQKKRKGGAAL